MTATGRDVSSSGTGSLARLDQLGRPSGAAAPRPRRRLGAAAPRAGPRVPTPGAALCRNGSQVFVVKRTGTNGFGVKHAGMQTFVHGMFEVAHRSVNSAPKIGHLWKFDIDSSPLVSEF